MSHVVICKVNHSQILWQNSKAHSSNVSLSHTACFPSFQIFAVRVHFPSCLPFHQRNIMLAKHTAHNQNEKTANKYNVVRMNQASLISFWFNEAVLFNNYSTSLGKNKTREKQCNHAASKNQFIYTSLPWIMRGMKSLVVSPLLGYCFLGHVLSEGC